MANETIETYTYLQDSKHYEDRYDKMTIEDCRGIEREIMSVDFSKYKGKESKEEKIITLRSVASVASWARAGDLYEQRKDTIEKWIDEDKRKDAIVNNAEPSTVACQKCESGMSCFSKVLHSQGDRVDKVIFIYKCQSCNNRKAYWSDGEEFKSNLRCDKCSGEIESEHKRQADKVITLYKCRDCGHTETEELDLTEKQERVDEYYEADKKRFCFTEKEGADYADFKFRMKNLDEIMKKIEDKEKNKSLYEKAEKITKLNIAELSGLLIGELNKHNYTNLELNKPEIGKNVVISFSLHDSATGRSSYDSRMGLKKALGAILQPTNWRLMSEGVDFRMGILTGRLKGFDREEDLLDLAKKL